MQAPSPPNWTQKILFLAPDGTGTLLTIDGGSKIGIQDRWRAYIIDADDLKIPHGDLQITRVMERTTKARSSLSPTQVERYKQVRIEER